MANFVCVRIKKENNKGNQIGHDFKNSHNSKSNNRKNLFITADKSEEFVRDTDVMINNSILSGSIHNVIAKANNHNKKIKGKSISGNAKMKWSGLISFGNSDKTLSRAEMDSINGKELDKSALKFIEQFAEKMVLISNHFI